MTRTVRFSFLGILFSYILMSSGVLAMFAPTVFAMPAAPAAPAASAPMKLSVLDTVAGYEATLSLSNAPVFSAIQLFVIDPLGQSKKYAAQTDADGTLSVRLGASSLSISGTYRAKAVATYVRSPEVLFHVYPDTQSNERVDVHTSKDVVDTQGLDFSLVTIRVTDNLGNPFTHHSISVRPFRTNDVVRPYTPSQSVTDEQGLIQFAVTSRIEGSGIFAVSDETTGRALTTFPLTFRSETPRATSSYSSFTPFRFDLGVGGDATSTVPPTQLAFENLKSPLAVNQPLDFTISANTPDKVPSSTYRGTVHFSAEGDNAVFVDLPKEYTFTEADQGRHIFPLAIQFKQEGSFILKAEDKEKPSLSGTFTATVKGGSTKTTTANVTITQPSPGSYASSAQTVEGAAPAGKDVKIYDSSEEIGTATAKADGQYTYITKPLSDGPHEFTVVSVDQKGAILATSPKVKIVIDTQPPALLGIDLEPGWQVQQNTPVSIKVHSEPHVKKSQVDVGGQLVDLQESPSEDGLYIGSFASPKPGKYPVKVILADALSNETSVTADKTLTVRGGPNKPVRDVQATPDSYKVSVSWKEPEEAFDIQKYRIYYGADYKNFTTFIDTNGPVTSYTVPNLENGVQYYFGVVAVDSKNALGEGGTLGIATPKDSGAIGGLPAAPQDVSQGKEVRGDTGPEVLWLIPLSGILSFAVRSVRTTRRRKK